jgi:hypothetical protein
MSEFDFSVASWTVHGNGDHWSVLEQAGSERTRYWFGPMKEDDVEPFIAGRKSHFARIMTRYPGAGRVSADHPGADHAAAT